jgi:hypothetical protein
MKTFKQTAAQGEVTLTRVGALPDGLTPQAPIDGRVIVAHSETGHHHVMEIEREKEPAVEFMPGSDPLTAWLRVHRPTALVHLRGHDTHEPLMVSPGLYRCDYAREYNPYEDAIRRVAD